MKWHPKMSFSWKHSLWCSAWQATVAKDSQRSAKALVGIRYTERLSRRPLRALEPEKILKGSHIIILDSLLVILLLVLKHTIQLKGFPCSWIQGYWSTAIPVKTRYQCTVIAFTPVRIDSSPLSFNPEMFKRGF